jgi:hypothetical protein
LLLQRSFQREQEYSVLVFQVVQLNSFELVTLPVILEIMPTSAAIDVLQGGSSNFIPALMNFQRE